MSKNSLFILLAIFALFVASIIFFFRPQQPPPTQPEQPVATLAPQENSGGDVDIKVTPKVLAVGEKPQFEIEFNTHSVELDFDIVRVVSLTDDQNNFYTDPAWEGSPPGGHHRSGTLTFATTLKNSRSVILVLRDISGISERPFTWQI